MGGLILGDGVQAYGIAALVEEFGGTVLVFEVVENPDGDWLMAEARLSAWQRIDLPRQWDDPECERDGGPDAQLADFASRVREELFGWGDCLRYLG